VPLTLWHTARDNKIAQWNKLDELIVIQADFEQWLRDVVWPSIDHALELLEKVPPPSRHCEKLGRYSSMVRIAYDRVVVIDTKNLVLARAVQSHYGFDRATFDRTRRRLSVVIRRV
jgi:hypothetical protein